LGHSHQEDLFTKLKRKIGKRQRAGGRRKKKTSKILSTRLKDKAPFLKPEQRGIAGT